MDKQLNDKLMKILYESGKKNAINEEKWDEFYNNFKAEDRFQLLYTIIDLNSLAKNKNGYSQIENILTYESENRTLEDFNTILKGFSLLKNSKDYFQNLKKVNAVITSSAPRAKDHKKWFDFCNQYHSNNKFEVLYAIVNLDNIASSDNDIFAETRKCLKTEKDNISDSHDYQSLLAGLRLMKNGNKFIRYMNDHKNDNSFNRRKNSKIMGF